MPIEVTLQLSPKQAADEQVYAPIAARLAGIQQDQIAFLRVVKRSIDARRSTPKVNLTIQIFVDTDQQPQQPVFEWRDVSSATPVVIVGSGPAGLFAALKLIECGFKPIILERGKDVSSRKKDIADINRNNPINPESNYAFGEGGAGTFSDGKLFTRSKKRGDHFRALNILCMHGADAQILYEAHPHIGTEKLPQIIESIRRAIISYGGEVHFEHKVTDFVIHNSHIAGVRCGDTTVEGAAVILATGHSAKDIYYTLHNAGVTLQAKPFAMGVRVEHPQSLIDSTQYNMPDRGEYLPAASYSLVTQVGGRGVYSFCMCPGGFIVPAMTCQQESVVNGMSPSGRNSIYANSGIVTEIKLSDFAPLNQEFGVLAGLKFQEQFEQAAKQHGGEFQIAPAQRLADFMDKKPSGSLPKTSYVPGIATSNMGEWMPRFIYNSLRGGFADFGRKMRGFVTNEAVVVGVESRTSSPVRIPRDPQTLMHPQIVGLFPSGEGAGYAGGIISAAIDGERVAEQVAVFLK